MTTLSQIDEAIEEIRNNAREARSRNEPEEVRIHEKQLEHLLKRRNEILAQQSRKP